MNDAINWTVSEENSNTHEALVGFGVTDSKGREIGQRARVSFRPAQEASQYWPACAARWVLRMHATRNGEWFGASHGEVQVASLDEGKALAAKKIEAARKRETKKAAKAAA